MISSHSLWPGSAEGGLEPTIGVDQLVVSLSACREADFSRAFADLLKDQVMRNCLSDLYPLSPGGRVTFYPPLLSPRVGGRLKKGERTSFYNYPHPNPLPSETVS